MYCQNVYRYVSQMKFYDFWRCQLHFFPLLFHMTFPRKKIQMPLCIVTVPTFCGSFKYGSSVSLKLYLLLLPLEGASWCCCNTPEGAVNSSVEMRHPLFIHTIVDGIMVSVISELLYVWQACWCSDSCHCSCTAQRATHVNGSIFTYLLKC